MAEERLIVDDSVEIAEMTADLEEYYECAGFAYFYNRVLKGMTDDQIREYHRKTFDEQTDFELEMWERKRNGEL